VFESEEQCMQSVVANEIRDGSVVVIRNEGPVGGPGMRELVTVTALLQGMKKASRWSRTAASPARPTVSASVMSRPRQRLAA